MSRKHIFQLLALVLLGLGLGQILRQAVPLGRDLSGNATAQAVLVDGNYPTGNVPEPTLTLIVFTDYQCPACRLAEPAMSAALAADGHVRVIYRDWPIFGPFSERAARVAIAADRQGIYPTLHSLLMREARVLDDAVLKELVERSGGRWAGIEYDMNAHGAEIDAKLIATRRAVFSLGIAGTPAYLVGPILVSGARDQGEFRRVFAQARKTVSSHE